MKNEQLQILTKNEIALLKDLHDLCIEDDLLDLDSYDSISRSRKVSNAWKALDVILQLISQVSEEEK